MLVGRHNSDIRGDALLIFVCYMSWTAQANYIFKVPFFFQEDILGLFCLNNSVRVLEKRIYEHFSEIQSRIIGDIPPKL